tara:strand:- start:3375 stop:4373 length:999 start_codon:yes stop_codon:yes gene_type:complete
MATYTAGQLEGAGTPIEALTEEITYTFTITSTGDNSSYFTIETAKDGRGVYNSTSPNNANGEYTAFNKIDKNTLITSSYISSVVVPKSGGTYSFTPKASITAGSSYLRGTGGITLSISDGTYVFDNKAELQTAIDLWITNNNAALATYGEINTWNVSAITDMEELFQNKTTFNSDISNWDVSNVTTMREMFDNATIFNQNIGTWDVSSVTDMYQMFITATSFNSPINDWDVSNVTKIRDMFYNASAFQQPLNLWELNSLTDGQLFMGTSGGAGAITYTLLDTLYNGWVVDFAALQSNVVISFGDSTFTSAGLAAKNILVNDKGWTITDGGQV